MALCGSKHAISEGDKDFLPARVWTQHDMHASKLKKARAGADIVMARSDWRKVAASYDEYEGPQTRLFAKSMSTDGWMNFDRKTVVKIDEQSFL